MKNSKLLSKNFLFIILILLTSLKAHSSEKPIDIWKANEEKNDQNSETISTIDGDNNLLKEISIYKKKTNDEAVSIVQDTSLNSKNTKIIGLYDPQDYDLDINMWSNSDGDQLKDLFKRITKMNLSQDASELMNVSILINAHYPKKNITEKEFLRLKSDWLIKNSNFDLIEKYLKRILSYPNTLLIIIYQSLN